MTEQNILVKQITEDEFDEFFTLYERLVKTEFPEYPEKVREFIVKHPQEWNKQKLSFLLKEQQCYFLAAKLNNKIVGLLYAFKPQGGVSIGLWLMVDPQFQHKGVGKILLTNWEQLALKDKCHSLQLAAPDRNIEFYKKMGFDLIGLYKKAWYGADEYLFSKLIQEPKEENFTIV